MNIPVYINWPIEYVMRANIYRAAFLLHKIARKRRNRPGRCSSGWARVRIQWHWFFSSHSDLVSSPHQSSPKQAQTAFKHGYIFSNSEVRCFTDVPVWSFVHVQLCPDLCACDPASGGGFLEREKRQRASSRGAAVVERERRGRVEHMGVWDGGPTALHQPDRQQGVLAVQLRDAGAVAGPGAAGGAQVWVSLAAADCRGADPDNHKRTGV